MKYSSQVRFQIVQQFLRRKQKYEMLTDDAEEDKDILDRHKVTTIAQMESWT